MSRFSYLVRHPKRSLGALAALMVAVGLTVGSGAYFTTQDSSGNNTINAGHVSLAEYGSDTPTIDAGSFAPGTSAVGPHGESPANQHDGLTFGNATFTIDHAYPSKNVFVRDFAFANNGTVPEYLKLSLVPTPGSSNDLLQATRVAIKRVPLGPELAGAGYTAPVDPNDGNFDGGPNGGQSVIGTLLTPVALQDSGNNPTITNIPGDQDQANPENRIILMPHQAYQYQMAISIPDTGSNQNNLEDQSEGFTIVGTANTNSTV